MLRKKVLKCISRGPNHLYAIAKKIDEGMSSVNQALKRLEEMELVLSNPRGFRNKITYELTSYGQHALQLHEYVEKAGSVPKRDLVHEYGEDIVRRACDADLIKVVKYETFEEIVEPNPPRTKNIEERQSISYIPIVSVYRTYHRFAVATRKWAMDAKTVIRELARLESVS